MTPGVDEQAAAELASALQAAARIVVFTGAGVSTDCGIPDFRSPTGIWQDNKPISFQEFMASEEMRREAWRRKFAIQPSFEAAERDGVKKSPAHSAIRTLYETGRVSAVITQNIDNLHQASGIPADDVVELHGNGSYAACLDCGTRHELPFIRERFDDAGGPPPCTACGGTLKTATISFGQSMPQEEMLRAQAETLACDLFLALGSSLVVHPAATLPALAAQNGARLAIVNREETPLDGHAEIVVRGDIGVAFRPWLSARAR
ncbi:Sir2 family NAD-dependent protein deacetylase [Tepidamorphus sp. 3E244]|uniref:Sir2 family NAD-dependent protein deacetylase n=1 Tax=Tepidamorphus sp. 3E244 TaxID=3385498 RepID=UPI0038FC273D